MEVSGTNHHKPNRQKHAQSSYISAPSPIIEKRHRKKTSRVSVLQPKKQYPCYIGPGRPGRSKSEPSDRINRSSRSPQSIPRHFRSLERPPEYLLASCNADIKTVFPKPRPSLIRFGALIREWISSVTCTKSHTRQKSSDFV